MPRTSRKDIDEAMGFGQPTSTPTNVTPLMAPLQPLVEPSKREFYKNPWFKLGSIGSGLIVVVWLFSQAFSGSSISSSGNTTLASLSDEEKKKFELIRQLQEENDRLKGNMALNQQIQDQSIPKPPASPSPTLRAQAPVPPPPAPVRTRQYPSYTRSYSRPTYRAPAPRSTPSYPAYPTYTGVSTSPTDPLAEWQRMAGNTFYAPGGNQGDTQQWQQNQESPQVGGNNNLPTSPLPGVPLANESRIPPSIGSHGQLSIDSRVSAKLKNAVAWAQGSNNPVQETVILQLTRAFRNREGQEVIPAGTLVVAKVSKVSQGGIFTLNVEEFNLADGKTIRVPAGSIIVQQKNRGFLQAKLLRPGRGLGRVFAQIGLGGLNAASSAISQSNTSSFYGNGYSSFSQGRSNPFAAGVSGMTGQALNQVNQSVNQQFQNQGTTSLYVMQAGATVELYVQQDVSL